MIRGRISLLVLVPLICLLSLFFHLQRNQWKPPKEWIPTASEPPSCQDGLNWPDFPMISGKIKYARREIQVVPSEDLQRASITRLDGPLFPKLQEVDTSERPNIQLKHCMDPLILDVPSWPQEPVNASHIIFGISTPLDRLEESTVYLERWLRFTGARLFVVVTGREESSPDESRMSELESKFRSLGMQVTIVKPLSKNDVGSQRYFSLTKVMYSNRDSNTQWIVLIDDDTFFPSMHTLVNMLSGYDSKKLYYIGGLSEDWWSVARYGMMGFGGAGVFLSIALAEVMDANYDDCRRYSDTGSGDVGIMECVYKYSNTKLTHNTALHQIDLPGDMSGIYESGRLPLSLHHWKRGWWDESDGPQFPMTDMHLVADICGDCFLQRWQFGKDMILSNGYSISIFPRDALNKFEVGMGLSKVEKTWGETRRVEESVNRGTDHDIGRTRPMLELEKEKIQYRFLHAIPLEGGVRQFYHHYGLEGGHDTLVELLWTQKDTTG